MSILWAFDPKTKSCSPPKISDQYLSISGHVLSLRNPWVANSVFMGKLYAASTALLMIFSYPMLFDLYTQQLLIDAHLYTALALLATFVPAPFLAYNILLLKKLSNIYLNRSTQKIYYQRFSKLISFGWNNTAGGIFARTEFCGASFTTSYALAFAPRRVDGSVHKSDCLWIDSNEPTESSILYVAEVWEYLRHFMAHGPDKLPPPGEPNWWHSPLHAISLTPAEAWRHYVPWRTGEPGEMQGKKNWQLPFWAVLFPYNLTAALCWYVVCRVFNVKAAPPPPEAFEEAPAKASKRKRR